MELETNVALQASTEKNSLDWVAAGLQHAQAITENRENAATELANDLAALTDAETDLSGPMHRAFATSFFQYFNLGNKTDDGAAAPLHVNKLNCLLASENADYFFQVAEFYPSFITDFAATGQIDVLRQYRFDDKAFWKKRLSGKQGVGVLLRYYNLNQFGVEVAAFVLDIFERDFISPEEDSSEFFQAFEHLHQNTANGAIVFNRIDYVRPDLTLSYLMKKAGHMNPNEFIDILLGDETGLYEKISSIKQNKTTNADLIWLFLNSLESLSARQRCIQRHLQALYDTLGLRPEVSVELEAALQGLSDYFKSEAERDVMSITGKRVFYWKRSSEAGEEEGVTIERAKYNKSDAKKAYLFGWLLVQLKNLPDETPESAYDIFQNFYLQLNHIKKLKIGTFVKKAKAFLAIACMLPPGLVKKYAQSFLDTMKSKNYRSPFGRANTYPDYVAHSAGNTFYKFYVKFAEFYERILEGIPHELLAEATPEQISNTVQVLHYMMLQRGLRSGAAFVFDGSLFGPDFYYVCGLRAGLCEGALLEAMVAQTVRIIERYDHVRIDNVDRQKFNRETSITYFTGIKQKKSLAERYHRTSPTQTKATFYLMLIFSIATARPEHVRDVISMLKANLINLNDHNKIRGVFYKQKQKATPSEFAKQCTALLEELGQDSPEMAIRKMRTRFENDYFEETTHIFFSLATRIFGLSDKMGHFAAIEDLTYGVFDEQTAPESPQAHYFIMARFVECYATIRGAGLRDVEKYNTIKDTLQSIGEAEPDAKLKIYQRYHKYLTSAAGRFIKETPLDKLHYPLAPSDDYQPDARVLAAAFPATMAETLRLNWYELTDFKAPISGGYEMPAIVEWVGNPVALKGPLITSTLSALQ